MTKTANLITGQTIRMGDKDYTVTGIQRDARGVYSVALTVVNGSPFQMQNPYTRRASANAKWFAAGTTITASMA